MEIILLQDVDNLGGPGEIVKVADGYGRNYLLPKKIAVSATPGNLKMLEQRREKLLREDAKTQAGAELQAAKIGELQAVITRKAGEKNVLFGSVTVLDVDEYLTSQGYKIDRKRIHLHQPIRALGDFDVPIKLHRQVTAHLKVRVEAEGGGIPEVQAEEEAAKPKAETKVETAAVEAEPAAEAAVEVETQAKAEAETEPEAETGTESEAKAE